jgi:hypothetical protein
MVGVAWNREAGESGHVLSEPSTALSPS